MFLRYRHANPADLVAARRTLAPFYGHDPQALNCFGEAWRRLIDSGAGCAVIIEDIANPAHPRPVAHGARVFLSEAMADDLRRGRLGPSASAGVLRRILTLGEGIPTRDELRTAQSESGVSLMYMHMAFESPEGPRFPGPQTMELMLQSYFHRHRGIHFRECFKEVFFEEEYRWFLGSGMRLENDHGRAEGPSLRQPYLLSVTRDDILRQPGTRMSTMFVTHPRRLGLTPAQSELVDAALEGRTDDELAEEWCVSLSAIKKRWLTIYDAVDRRLPGLLPTSDPFATTSRGAERRRHLLAYVREHPEEVVFIA